MILFGDRTTPISFAFRRRLAEVVDWLESLFASRVEYLAHGFARALRDAAGAGESDLTEVSERVH